MTIDALRELLAFFVGVALIGYGLSFVWSHWATVSLGGGLVAYAILA
jgi:hypothetical protein